MIPARLSAAVIGASAVLAVLLAGADAAAQPRQLGPPAGVDLEGSETEPQEKSDQTVDVPKPAAPAKAPGGAPEGGPAAAGKAGAAKGERLRTTSASDSEILLDIPLEQIPNYRGMMRDIVEELSRYARGRDPKFQVLARPGFDLLAYSQREYDLAEIKRDPAKVVPVEAIRQVGTPMRRTMQAIDGFVLSGHYCSPLRVPRADLAAMRKEGLRAVAVDLCPNESAVSAALQAAARDGIPTYATTADDPQFTQMPRRRPFPENPANVDAVSAARNMMVLLSARSFPTRDQWLNAMTSNNYDIMVIDAFDRTNRALTKAEVHQLKFKQLGARRLVLAHLDIGNADDSAFYWQRDWEPGKPSWIGGMTQDVPGQYFVEFWNPAWKAIVGKYLAGILDLGFDGVMLDGVEAYRRWEAKTPISPTR